jgi:hypothetical protein
MEPDRKIEKLLRAYAKKRRGQAGDSFKLDPATRRILQNEISGRAPSSEDDEDTMSLWELLRRHWRFFLGFGVCIFILASLILPAVYTARKRANLSMLSEPASLDLKPGPALAQGTLKKDEAPATNGVFAARANPQPAQVPLSDNASAPAPTAPPPQVAETEGATREPENTPPPPPAALTAEVPISPPPAGLPTRAEDNYAMAPTPTAESPQTPQSGGEVPGKFVAPPAPTQSLAVQNSYMNTIAPQLQSTPVLMNFQVMQDGNSIRVVDQDGSVYTGTLQPEELDANALPEGAVTVPAALGGAAAQSASASKVESPRMTESDKLASPGPSAPPARSWWPHFGGSSISAAAAMPAMPGGEGALSPPEDNGAGSSPQIYSFRVGGMNRTLKQSVVFTARLIDNLEMMKNTQVTFGMGANAAYGAAIAQQMMKSKQTNQASQLPWSSLYITGTAIVNRTNQIQVNAAPVPSSSNSAPPK